MSIIRSVALGVEQSFLVVLTNSRDTINFVLVTVQSYAVLWLLCDTNYIAARKNVTLNIQLLKPDFRLTDQK